MKTQLYEYFTSLHPYTDKFVIYYNDVYKHIDILPCYTQLCLQTLKSEGKIDYNKFTGGAYIIMIKEENN